jgi:hypothetical protein
LAARSLSPNSGAVISYSKRSPTVALSSTQSETDALVELLKEVNWLSGFLDSLYIHRPRPIIVYVDNRPLTEIAQEIYNGPKIKHFIIKCDYIQQEQDRGMVNIQYIKGIDNHADILTKTLRGSALRNHTAALLGYTHTDEQDDGSNIVQENIEYVAKYVMAAPNLNVWGDPDASEDDGRPVLPIDMKHDDT